MSDLLDMEYINSLPQPLWAKISGEWWPVESIDVQSGLFRFDVVGMLQVESIGSVFKFRDDSGKEHDADDFYSGSERAAQQSKGESKP